MKSQKNGNGANLGFEQKLWLAADKMRSNMDAAEYKHVVLGLIFLKYISDAFSEVHEELKKDKTSDPEDIDEYISRRIFWVPKKARWDYISNNAKKPEIGKIIDDAMDAIEKDNPSLRGVLQKNYARPALNKQRLGELIDLIGTIGLGDKESKSKDILGRVYEYFLGQFADAEGKKGGQFYTPRSIVNLLVEMLEPYKGRIFDPCCGSGGMFVQSEKFIEAHGGKIGDISVYGQESNQTTWRLCKMNLAIRGIDANVEWGDSFRDDQFKDLKADFVLANPPFNDSDWGGELLQDDVRWKFGVPPKGNANFAWVQHFIHHLSPAGTAGFVLANGSMSSNTSGEGEIRKNIIEADLVDCMVALPGQLFYNTMIPACLWFVSRDKKNHKFRDRRNQVLFIDARKLGVMVDRRHRELTDEDIKRISDTYHAWRGELKDKKYKDVPGFCKSASLDEIRKHEWILTPGRYVGAEEEEEDDEVFEEKMKKLTSELSKQMEEGKRLDEEIKKNLESIGFVIK
ncbi:putative type I restriction enzyme HindVIIP M protein [Candidatus Nitrosotenuis uzonensis]|uniref:site-specific DNA-methyltransferase (adenine-specific) n=2 Tax=Candidatus Nitrosotenuis uzonensis TaxID=1407055 RepID=A0A812F2E2_9ARCH|nr:class I SAM-dependent DNA methyltransferase [Candidatus Nitrosotenuis uzonensis]CAE6500799.1 putative type I restriction enzyme HindVIIP M protein [Candidatus Nitrosotenuis uzonensis]